MPAASVPQNQKLGKAPAVAPRGYSFRGPAKSSDSSGISFVAAHTNSINFEAFDAVRPDLLTPHFPHRLFEGQPLQ